MPDTKGVTISTKSLSTWLAIAVLAITQIVSTALTRDKVTRHDALLNQYNIPVMNTQMENIAEDVTELKVMFTDFVKEYNEQN